MGTTTVEPTLDWWAEDGSEIETVYEAELHLIAPEAMAVLDAYRSRKTSYAHTA